MVDLATALALFSAWEKGEGEGSFAELLERNPHLRHLLEPLGENQEDRATETGDLLVEGAHGEGRTLGNYRIISEIGRGGWVWYTRRSKGA